MTVALVMDTATEHCVLGLGEWSGRPGIGSTTVVSSLDFLAPRAALSRLLPAALEMLDLAGVDISSIGAVVCGRGPGSFTGVRIGLATAKGLAYGLRVPLYGVTTIDAVAWRFAGQEGLVGIVGDAMRREVYPVLFRCSGGGVTRLEDYTVKGPVEAARDWAAGTEGRLVLAGNGLAKYADVFLAELGSRAASAPDEMWHPTAEGLFAALEASFEPRRPADPGVLLPIYTRLSDAEENERLNQARRGGLPPCGVAGLGSPEDRP